MEERQMMKVATSKIKATSDYCIYCGMYLRDWEKVIDHFKPIASDGFKANKPRNLFVSCRECNSVKSNKVFDSLQEAREYILDILKGNPSTRLKVCKLCKQEFFTTSTRKKHCIVCVKDRAKRWYKDHHQKKERTIKVKKCKNCSDKFKTIYSHQSYCSSDCVTLYKKSKQKGFKEGKEKRCITCNEKFVTYYPQQIFCDPSCNPNIVLKKNIND